MERNEENNTELSLESIIAEVKSKEPGQSAPAFSADRDDRGEAPLHPENTDEPAQPAPRALPEDAPPVSGRFWKTEVFSAPPELDMEQATAPEEGEEPVADPPEKGRKPKKKRELPYDCIRYYREDPADTVAYLRKKIRRVTPRILLLALLTGAALYLLGAEAYPLPLPALMTQRVRDAAACVCLLAAMLCSWESQWSGLKRLARLHPSLDSLVFVQCAAMLTHGVWRVFFSAGAGTGSFCAIGVASCFFVMIQKRSRMIAVRRSHKAAMMGAMPAGVKVCSDCAGNLVAVKTHEGAEPDFAQMCRMDRTEEASLWFSPLLLLMMVLLSLVTAYLKNSWADMPFYLAAMTAVSVPAGLILSSAQVTKKVGKQLFGSGSVLLSGQHAKQVAKANFAILCDSDLYPIGTMKISGMKVVSGFSVETVVSYTAGVMIFLGGGIGKAFSEFAREQYLFPAKVQQQKFFESGGISAEIEGHTVLVGPALFLNRFGIAVTAGKKVRKGVFVAIDGRFAGLFSVNSVPQSQVYHGFTLLRQAKIRPVLDVLNFLTDQEEIEEQFELRTDSTDYPDLNERIYGSECEFGVDEPPMALLARDGMLPFAEVLLGAKRQAKATTFSLVMGLLSAGFGVAVMYFLLYSGAAAATPVNALLYTALWSLPVWFATGTTAKI